ncbi:MAG: hypothetical protein FI680_03425 [SAR202 cluster bacterium]|nr:hypothetical protein [SAR202 cluster bacterium]
MRVSDALRFLLSPTYLMLFGRLLRSQSRSAFEFRGMDLSHVMSSEVFASMVRVPVDLLYMEAVRRFVTEHQVRDLIHPFFEYSWGKAILYGAADSEFECRNISIQHGCFASNLLVAINDPQDFRNHAEGGNGIHLPLATGYYIDGVIPKSCLAESGYPEDRLFALGAPRFDTLGISKEGGVSHEVTEIVAQARNENGRVMLLVPVPNDMQQFASFMEDALADLNPEECLFLWKFPPNVSQKGREEFAAQSPFLAQGHALIVEAPIYHLMNLADTVVTTLSTAGLEALEMGKDVICVSLPGGLNLSPLIDGGDSVPIVYDPTELSGVSDGLDRTGAGAGKLAGQNITGQVGNAAERIADHMTCVFLDSDAGFVGEKPGREQEM